MPGRSAWLLLAAVGAADTGATLLYGAATTRGLLSIVAVLSSLYPIVIGVLARILLNERNDRTDAAGDVHCNEFADLVHPAVRGIETLAPYRPRVSTQVEQAYVDLGVVAAFRNRQIEQIVEAQPAQLMFSNGAGRGRGTRRERGDHVETA